MIRSRTDFLGDPELEAQRSKIRWLRSELARQSPIAPASAPGFATAWLPTHFVPAGGIGAWAAPDPSGRPIAVLPENMPLVVIARAGEWARVAAQNGWTGWVDCRLLVAHR
jgi:hypothetical protein